MTGSKLKSSPSGLAKGIVSGRDSRAMYSEQLPTWWRCVLIVLATVILCACNGPMSRTHLTPDPALLETPVESGEAILAPPAIEVCDDTTTEACCEFDPYGPMPGPSDEYLCDGGDFVTPAGVRADWNVMGLEQEDTVGHYDTMDGRVMVTPSNRVCVYAPKFAAVRRVVQPLAHEQPVFINETREDRSLAKATKALPPIAQVQRHAVSINLGQQPPSLFRQRQQAGGMENLQATMDAFTSLAAYADFSVIRTGEVSDAEKALVEKSRQAALAWMGDQAPQIVFGVKQAHAAVGVRQPGIVYQTDGPDHPEMRLIKLASTNHAAPGEEIEFTLRYDNTGDQEIG
ncbi:MAG: hypothetical protein IT425_06780, partial [Pirellulales bacterium]|nr:hypothetical protein [Pirellulales bacterium]